jgi:dihydrodipicolinate synthase/N-acetylneuraminate lyase
MSAEILAPLISPRDDRGGLDLEGLSLNVARLAASLDGFLVLGSSGEYVYLSEQERLDAVRTVLSGAGSRKVFVQVGAETTAASARLAEDAMALGASGLLAVTPHYYTPQLKGRALVAYYKTIASIGPTYLYHIPSYTGMTLEVDDILEIAGVPGIVGMKDSTGNLALLTEILASRPEGFTYYVGSGGALLAAVAHGAQGTIAALANLVPERMRAVLSMFEAGEIAAAAQAQRPLARLNALVTRRHGIPGLKYAAGRLGFAAGDPVPPLLPVPEKAAYEIDEALLALSVGTTG